MGWGRFGACSGSSAYRRGNNRGEARLGRAGRGWAGRGRARRGSARQGKARLGKARQGKVVINNTLSKRKIDEEYRGYEKLLVAIAVQSIQDYLNGPSEEDMRNYSNLKHYQKENLNERNRDYKNAKHYIFDSKADKSVFGFSFIMDYFQIDIPRARKNIRLSDSKQTALRSLSLDGK